MVSRDLPLSRFSHEETRQLFYQRTLICLWLAVVFFPLFALLDYVYCREFFARFLLYRLAFVIYLLTMINLLRLPAYRHLAPHVMFVSIQLGCLVISVMAVHLGGFSSGYYVGIMLMIAGALSVLPLKGFQAAGYGLTMYAVYLATILIGTGLPDRDQLIQAASNSFFFLAIVAIASVQSFDDLHTISRQLRAKDNIRKLREQLTAYTDDLENNVQQRVRALQETDLQYRELYDNIMDLVVLVDDQGAIVEANRVWQEVLGVPAATLHGTNIRDQLAHGNLKTDWLSHVLLQLGRDLPVRGMPLNLLCGGSTPREVELSASKVILDNALCYQLILRDISDTKSMERKLVDAERQVAVSRQATIFGLARLAECRDDDTGQHLDRIRSYTRLLVEELANSPEYGHQITDQFIHEIGYSAVLHDIGKVGIPDAILLKPGRLTTEEFERMKQHTVFGANVLATANQDRENLSFLKLGWEIARSHHERWDASGYPDGLTGSDIPLAARIIALADVYDALTSSRVYKPPFSHAESRAIIVAESGSQFDPVVVKAFLRREEDFKETRMRLLLQQPENGEPQPS